MNAQASCQKHTAQQRCKHFWLQSFFPADEVSHDLAEVLSGVPEATLWVLKPQELLHKPQGLLVPF